MTDWTAIAAVATVGLVIVGFLQVRATKLGSGNAAKHGTLSDRVLEPPLLHYKIKTGSDSYPFPQGWKSDVLDPRRDKQYEIERDLESFKFALLDLENRGETVLARVAVELDCLSPWSAKVVSTKLISPNAIRVAIHEKRIVFETDELPGHEHLQIAVAARSIYGMSALNAAVKLINLEWSHA